MFSNAKCEIQKETNTEKVFAKTTQRNDARRRSKIYFKRDILIPAKLPRKRLRGSFCFIND